MAGGDAPRRSDLNAEGEFSASWFVGHFLVFLALIDAFLFRSLLTPELLESDAAINEQVRRLFLWASVAFGPMILLYAIIRRTARGRARLYHLGAWIFFGLTVYFLIEDYNQYAEPGTFSARINLALGRVESFIGFDLPRLE